MPRLYLPPQLRDSPQARLVVMEEWTTEMVKMANPLYAVVRWPHTPEQGFTERLLVKGGTMVRCPFSGGIRIR